MVKADNPFIVLKMIVCSKGKEGLLIDLPFFRSSTFTDEPCLTNPLGAKGVGEIGTVGSIPTIANAILDALWDQGVRKFDMPAYPQKIWKLLQEAKNLRQ